MNANSTPLLSSDASLPEQTLWFGEAELHETCIVVSGWTWSGRYERRIDINDIEQAETWSRSGGANLVLHIDTNHELLRLKTGIMLWHWKLKELGVEVVGRG
jgi:hypothetical protein